MGNESPIEERESYLLHKALSLFLAFGIRAVSMKDISDSIGMSTKTLYSFFKSKKTLLKACIRELIDRQLKELFLIENMPDSRIEKVFLIYKISLEHIVNQSVSFSNDLKRDYPHIYNFYKAQYEDFLNNRIYMMLSETQNKGEIIAEVDLDLFCQINLFKLKELTNKDIHEKNQQDRILNHTIVVSLRGILENPNSISWK